MDDKKLSAGEVGLEVVGYTAQQDIDWQGDCALRKAPMLDYSIPLVRLSDAQRLLAAARLQTAMLAACAKNVADERDQLRALLTAQPQASVCETMGRPKAECGCPDCGSSLIDWPQASAAQSAPSTGIYSSDPLACSGCAKGCFRCKSQAQSAPAGERETIRAVFLRNGFTVKEGQTDLKPYVYAAAEELLSIARAAWQRAQSAPVVPEGWRLVMAIELAEEKHGSLRAAARALGIDAGYLSRLKKGEKVNPSEEVLAALGLERMTMYRASQQCTQSSWVPDGWQLVPKEPTAEMIEALAASFWPADWEAGKRLQRLRGTKVVFPKTEIEMAVGKYERVLSAAPAQPAAQGVETHQINCNAVSQYPAGKCNCGKGE